MGIQRIERVFAAGWKITQYLLHDVANTFRYGFRAPRKFQKIYVDPLDISEICTGFRGTTELEPASPRTPAVIGGDWDLKTDPIDSKNSIRMVKRRIVEGVGWDATVEFHRAIQLIETRGHYRNRFFTTDELVDNYNNLDNIIAGIAKDGRLKTMREMSRHSFRERGGIGVMVARDGRILKSETGNHRLAIAQALGLKSVPVCVYAVHTQSIESGKWRLILRRSSELRKIAS